MTIGPGPGGASVGAETQTRREGRRGRFLFVTGAGVSKASGVPTFRGRHGYWQDRDVRRLATREAFTQDPALVWRWYDERRQLLARVRPNAAHAAIARLESLGHEVVVLTQNVDDLHEQAGSTRVLHIHGSIWEVAPLDGGPATPNRQVPLTELPLRDAEGSLMRPTVVWFDEELPADVVKAIEDELGRPFDAVIVVGTSGTFAYITKWAIRAAGDSGRVIEVNPHPTGVDGRVDQTIRGLAEQALPALVEELHDAVG